MLTNPYTHINTQMQMNNLQEQEEARSESKSARKVKNYKGALRKIIVGT